MTDQERSLSRGREAFQSTGRGGIGNIRQASVSRDARPDTGPDDFSVTRGREALASPNQVYSTGRGGAGNLHSPSRDASRVRPAQDKVEQEVIREYAAAHENAPFSSGRGGIGNINRSRSRDPALSTTTSRTGVSPGPHGSAHVTHAVHAVHSTGRGGAGNIYPGDGVRADVIDEEERKRVGGGGGVYHSTGRGGIANISNAPEPAVERHAHDAPEYESTGRGGVGNIVRETGSRDRSRSQQRA
ncbi:hypothetical protein BJ912DRAFT_1082102 [Pholiota molesta]|nr:hypothetical protein BJ912DRAFT_1082102 [Pholiota molesta]